MSIFKTATNIVLRIKQKTDVQNIALYNQENNQKIFPSLQFLDASVQDDKKLMEHPKENGAMVVDHVVDIQKTVSMQVIFSDDNTDVLNEIMDYYNSSSPIVCKIKNEVFSNLVMSAKPLKVDTSHYDKTVYDLTFKEIQEAQTLYVKMSVPQVKQKRSASTVKTGHKQPQKSIAFKIKQRLGL